MAGTPRNVVLLPGAPPAPARPVRTGGSGLGPAPCPPPWCRWWSGPPWRPDYPPGAAVVASLPRIHGVGPPRSTPWCAIGALVVPSPSRSAPTTPTTTPTASGGRTTSGSGPSAWWHRRLASPRAVDGRRSLAFGVAGVAGRRGWPGPRRWWVLLVGPAACVARRVVLPGGPRPYGYAGLGEVFVFVFFGLVATVGTFYVQTLRLGVPSSWCRRRPGRPAGHRAAVRQQPPGHRHRRRDRQADPGRAHRGTARAGATPCASCCVRRAWPCGHRGAGPSAHRAASASAGCRSSPVSPAVRSRRRGSGAPAAPCGHRPPAARLRHPVWLPSWPWIG